MGAQDIQLLCAIINIVCFLIVMGSLISINRSKKKIKDIHTKGWE
jgi:hypothetical protein